MVTGLWLHIAVPVLTLALAARALWALAAVERCANWLTRFADSANVADQAGPWIVMVVPMLREQAVAAQAVAALAALPHVPGRAAIIIVTTQRETTARAAARTTLPGLVEAGPLTAARLRGLFPAERCAAVADTVNAAAPQTRLAVVQDLFDSEPDTATLVEEALAVTGPLPALHLHQPDVGGRKAGQLNYALEHLPKVLAPLGWDESTDSGETFIAVYDADAVPDARTLPALAAGATAHRARTGRYPALIQQQRLPLIARRPFPPGPAGLVLTEEWIYQLRRSLGIELARISLGARVAASRMPRWTKTLLRPMVYGVGCGLVVHLPTLRALGGFPEPMEDIGIGHRISLLGEAITTVPVTVLDEPYTDTTGLINLHALAFSASVRPDRHVGATANVPHILSGTARAVLVVREWGDDAAWLIGAPLAMAAVVSSPAAGSVWAVIATLGVLIHGPVQTARLLMWAPRLRAAFQPGPAVVLPPPPHSRRSRKLLVAASLIQPFTRLAGPWLLIIRKVAQRRYVFGKTER